MMISRFLSGLLVLTVLVVTGCGGGGAVRDDPEVDDRSRPVGDLNGATTTPLSNNVPGAFSGTPMDPDSVLYTKVIYFEFDRSDIRTEYLGLLRAHAAYLAEDPARVVTIEGHADERGSREYNIALGERRAKAVQGFLESQGVDPGQMTYISYGEERPEVDGNNEDAWYKNRRAVLVY